MENDKSQVPTNGLESHSNEPEMAGSEEPVQQNGVSHLSVEEVGERGRWRFPPVLEDFDLMETEADPDELEIMFHDDRLVYVCTE